jgi:S1-C subfamily serine protease
MTRPRRFTVLVSAALGLALLSVPSSATAQALPDAAREKIKAATVYVKLTAGNMRATGSGFLVKKSEDGKVGYVATNDHVAVPRKVPAALRNTPFVTTVVFNSGTPTEWEVPATCIARDPERDLAVLRFAATKPLPAPLPQSQSAVKAAETTPVYVCGFPFGDMLSAGEKNPEISIGQASVSSNRSDERGYLTQVQLNGALNPGNSGGPVVTADGKLLGVAVMTIKGAGLGLAVPQHMVGEMLRGRVSEPLLVRAGAQTYAIAWVSDPMGKLKSFRGVIAPPGASAAKTVPEVAKLPGASPIIFTLRPEEKGLAICPVNLPVGMDSAWVQAEWTDAGGVKYRGTAGRVPVLVAGRQQSPDDPDYDLPPDVSGGGPGGPGPDAFGRGPGVPPGGGGPGMDPRGRGQPRPNNPGSPAQPQDPRGLGQPRPGFGNSPPPMQDPRGGSPQQRPGGGTGGGDLLATVDANPTAFHNQRLTVEGYTRGMHRGGFGDGPALALTDLNDKPTVNLDFVLSQELVDLLRAAGVPDHAATNPRQRVSVSGRAEPSPSGKAWTVVRVDEVTLTDEVGGQSRVIRAGGASVAGTSPSDPGPAPGGPNGSMTGPSRSAPAAGQPMISSAPTVGSTHDDEEEGVSNKILVLGIVGAVVVVGVTAVVGFFIAQQSKAATAKRKPSRRRDRYRDDDYDNEDDYDDRPRRRRR